MDDNNINNYDGGNNKQNGPNKQIGRASCRERV